MFDPSTIGLTKRDMRIYEALFKTPHASLRALADATGINRGTVHESVKTMTKLGIVSFLETGKQRRYVAQDPAIIMALVKEQQQALRDAESQTQSYISNLQQVAKTTPQESFASFYEGDDGIATILRDVLSTTQELESKEYCVVSSKYVREYLYRNFPNFTRQRIRQHIFVRVIAIGEGGMADDQSNRKWLPPSEDTTAPNCYTIIYGEKTAFISLDGQNVPMGIVINNAGMTALQRLSFETVWKTL
jgi:HTH-type transcriptional regulator, sugar sensing transcriptional regulator